MADTKVSALSEASAPLLTDLLYTVSDPGGTPTSNKLTHARALGNWLPHLFQARLTTESGVPVSATDRTGQGTIYVTPYNGNRLCLYDGTRWKGYALSEISLALSGLTSGKNYDVFVYDNAGTLTIELSAAWTNDTTRADALTTQDGIYVKSSATTRRHVGTIRATAAATTEDSGGGTSSQVGGQRFVWNRYNQVSRQLSVIDTTDTWAYSTNTIRQKNGASGNKVEYVTGDAATLVMAFNLGSVAVKGNSANAAKAGVGIDSTTAFSGLVGAGFNDASTFVYSSVPGSYRGFPGLGYHYVASLEKGPDGTFSLFIGDNGGDSQQTGLHVTVMI